MNVQSKVFNAPDEQTAWLGSEPIPAKYYYDPEWFEQERQAIFMRTWLEVGHVCELPEKGSWIRRELEFANASILIVRGKDEGKEDKRSAHEGQITPLWCKKCKLQLSAHLEMPQGPC